MKPRCLEGTKTRTLVLALVLACACCRTSDASLFTDPQAGNALRAEIAAQPSGEIAVVHRLWTRYAESKQGYFDCAPSEFWTATEQGTWTAPDGHQLPLCYDLAGFLIYPPFKQEVIAIEPVPAADQKEYQLTVRFKFDSAAPNGMARPTVLVTHFAVREGNEWKLAGALGRMTRSWKRETVGPFTYIVDPRIEFSRVRAEQAVVFADSVAKLLGVPRLTPVHYYMMRNGDEMLHASGFLPDTVYGTPSARTVPGAIVSGDPVFGEMHGHEIVHILIRPLQGPNMSVIASEGVPTWLGGTRSMKYSEALIALRTYLQAHPTATLDTVLRSNANAMHNPGAALLSAMVFEHGGVNALRRFLDSGPSIEQFRDGVTEILGLSWGEITLEWKRRVLASGGAYRPETSGSERPI